MSRGYGTFQRAVMTEVERAGGRASTEQLREAFPRQALDKSLHRTIRSLERAGAVEVVARPGHVLGDRLVVLIFGHSDGDRELIRQTAELQGWVAWLARERGLPVPKPTSTDPRAKPERINQEQGRGTVDV